jgi:hypothetical protein
MQSHRVEATREEEEEGPFEEEEEEEEEEATKKQRASASIKEALVYTKNSRLALRSFLARTAAAATRQNATARGGEGGSDELDTRTPTDATRAAAEVRQFTCVTGAKVHALTHACVEVGAAKAQFSCVTSTKVQALTDTRAWRRWTWGPRATEC